jgi:endonuclease III
LENILRKIVEIGINRFSQTKREYIEFTGIGKADKLLNDIENNPHVFILAALMDRQIKAERAWGIPQQIFDIEGTNNFEEIANIKLYRIEKIFKDNSLHRFNTDMANVFYLGIQDIKNKYNCNASLIWQGKLSSASVVYRFLEFKGCGIKIATMAANILARHFKIEFKDYYSIDISPDVHIKRVMARTGLVKHDPSPEMVIYKARELYPEFPGVIDFSCWEIGKNWCFASKPDCGNCIIKDDCKKIIF